MVGGGDGGGGGGGGGGEDTLSPRVCCLCVLSNHILCSCSGCDGGASQMTNNVFDDVSCRQLDLALRTFANDSTTLNEDDRQIYENLLQFGGS